MNKAHFVSSFVIPLSLGVAFLLAGWAMSHYVNSAPAWAIRVAFAVGLLSLLVSVWLGIVASRQDKQEIGGGRGGGATVRGSHSRAYGGKGGSGSTSYGGDALVEGDNSHAQGGDGGPRA
jgi:hypothetical protein